LPVKSNIFWNLHPNGTPMGRAQKPLKTPIWEHYKRKTWLLGRGSDSTHRHTPKNPKRPPSYQGLNPRSPGPGLCSKKEQLPTSRKK